MNTAERIKRWLARQLGSAYEPTVMIAERVVSAFLLAFAGKLVGSGLDVRNVVDLSYWQTAFMAGVFAVLALLQSTLTRYVTGHPALLSLVSSTLRRQARLSDGLPPRPRSHVPYRRKQSTVTKRKAHTR